MKKILVLSVLLNSITVAFAQYTRVVDTLSAEDYLENPIMQLSPKPTFLYPMPFNDSEAYFLRVQLFHTDRATELYGAWVPWPEVDLNYQDSYLRRDSTTLFLYQYSNGYLHLLDSAQLLDTSHVRHYLWFSFPINRYGTIVDSIVDEETGMVYPHIADSFIVDTHRFKLEGIECHFNRPVVVHDTFAVGMIWPGTEVSMANYYYRFTQDNISEAMRWRERFYSTQSENAINYREPFTLDQTDYHQEYPLWDYMHVRMTPYPQPTPPDVDTTQPTPPDVDTTQPAPPDVDTTSGGDSVKVAAIERPVEVTLMPNPAKGKTTVRSSSLMTTLTLTSPAGQIVTTLYPRSNQAELPLVGLPSGCYIVTVTTTQSTSHHKLLVTGSK